MYPDCRYVGGSFGNLPNLDSFFKKHMEESIKYKNDEKSKFFERKILASLCILRLIRRNFTWKQVILLEKRFVILYNINCGDYRMIEGYR